MAREEVIEATTTLPAEPASAGRARRFVVEALTRWRREHVVDQVSLLTSELVTNAVLHARTEIVVSVRSKPDVVRVDVCDSSPQVPVRRHYADDAPTGRGLGLVEVMAGAWGVEACSTPGKRVWFEVPA